MQSDLDEGFGDEEEAAPQPRAEDLAEMAERARRLSASGAFDEARPLFETALAAPGAPEDLVHTFVRALIVADDLVAAWFWCARLGESYAGVRQALARMRRRQGKALFHAAERDEADGRLDLALARYRLMLALMPDALRQRLDAARFMISVGRYEAAEAHLEDAPDEPQVDSLRQAARELRARNPHRRSPQFLARLHAEALADLLAGRAALAEPVLRELTLCRPELPALWGDLHAARVILGKTREAERVRRDWMEAHPASAPVMDAALLRRRSARGLVFDRRERFPLAARDEALQRVATPAELKAASDACLMIDPGGRPIETRPFLDVMGQGRPGRIAYSTGEAFVLALDNAVVAGRGAVVTQSGQLITEQFLPHKVAKYHGALDGDGVRFAGAFGADRGISDFVEEPVFLCMGPTDASFGDWLMDFVPRLWLLKAAELDCKILLNRELPVSFLEMLEALGIRRSRMIFQRDRRAAVYRRLYVPSWPSGVRERPMGNWLSIFRRLDKTPVSPGPPLLYLSRKHVSNRRLVNEDEICELFVESGFTEVVPDDLSFQQTLDLFATPACVAGPWGSSFENVLFSRSSPIALALMPPYDAHYMQNVGIFMHEARIRFGYALGRSLAKKPNHAPWVISVDTAKRAIGRTLELVEKARARGL